MTKCPNWTSENWESNRDKVDDVILKSYEWIDLNNPEEIDKIKRQIALEVMAVWVRPCKACMKIDIFIKENKNKIQWITS